MTDTEKLDGRGLSAGQGPSSLLPCVPEMTSQQWLLLCVASFNIQNITQPLSISSEVSVAAFRNCEHSLEPHVDWSKVCLP